MEINLKAGLQHTSTKVVTKDDTASKYGSGLVEVFATPAMVGLMENAAMNAVLPHLPKGCGTVGTQICIAHSKATPVGMKVQATATLTNADGKRLSFEVVAQDEQGEVGRGTHERYVIEVEKFMSRINQK